MVEENFMVQDFDLLEELYKEADALLEQATRSANIGKFSSYTTCHVWYKGAGSQQVEPAEYQKFIPVRNEKGKFLYLHICIDLQEFDPNNTYTYDKWIMVKGGDNYVDVNGDGNKDKFQSDWFATWLPSVKDVFGNKYTTMVAALKDLNGKYVKILNVKQQPTAKNPVPAENHTTPKLVKVYESREAAYQDWQVMTGNSGQSVPTSSSQYDSQLVDGVKTFVEQGVNNAAFIAQQIGLTESDVQKIMESL